MDIIPYVAYLITFVFKMNAKNPESFHQLESCLHNEQNALLW